jgi:hypothetical protein
MKSIVKMTGRAGCGSPDEQGELLALERGETVLKFGHEIGLAVLPGGELQPAEELRGLMHQLDAHAA